MVIGAALKSMNRSASVIVQQKKPLDFASALAQTGLQVQKYNKRKETKQIVKGAVVGGIVAGDAGAVVGATIAKNKIDSKK